MAINRFTLSNFKAFGPAVQTVPIKPITLIFGPNSSGKSSILHSLLWLRHGITNGELDVQEPFGGQGINLGGFDQLIHGHNRSNTPVIGWSILGRSIKPGPGGWENLDRFDIELGYGRNQGTVNLQSCAVSTSEGLMFRASLRTETGWKIDTLDWEHSALQTLLVSGGVSSGNAKSKAKLERMDQAVSAGYYALEVRDFVPTYLGINSTAGIHMDDDWLLSEAIPGAFSRLLDAFRVEVDARIRKMIFVPPLRDLPVRGMDFRLGGSADWKNLVNHADRGSILKTLNGKLAAMGIRYEVHLRRLVSEETLIERVESNLLDWVAESAARAETLDESGDWGALSYDLGARRTYWEGDGWNNIQNKWEWIQAHPDFLQKLVAYWEEIVRNDRDLQFPYFEQNPDLDPDQPPPDDWISARAEELIGEEDPIFTEERTRILLAEDTELRAALSAGVDAKKHASSLRAETDPLESRMEVRLRDLQHNVWVSLQDVGVGISQVLPVLIEAVVGEDSLIAIEQPEIHIHPKLQAELGDVFIESALGDRKNTFLIETHSEHLILRILRRIRETTREKTGEWPNALHAACANGVRPEDVAVLYVEPGEEGAVVRELRINEQGRFVDEWPNGFFEERFNEEF